jgi:hypothetical protein
MTPEVRAARLGRPAIGSGIAGRAGCSPPPEVGHTGTRAPFRPVI